MNQQNTECMIALSLARDICPGCACLAWMPDGAPCPCFRPDNFYYDPMRKRFCCYSWSEEVRRTGTQA